MGGRTIANPSEGEDMATVVEAEDEMTYKELVCVDCGYDVFPVVRYEDLKCKNCGATSPAIITKELFEEDESQREAQEANERDDHVTWLISGK